MPGTFLTEQCVLTNGRSIFWTLSQTWLNALFSLPTMVEGDDGFQAQLQNPQCCILLQDVVNDVIIPNYSNNCLLL